MTSRVQTLHTILLSFGTAMYYQMGSEQLIFQSAWNRHEIQKQQQNRKLSGGKVEKNKGQVGEE